MAEWNNNIASFALPTPFPVGDVNVSVIKGEALTLVDAGVHTEEGKQALEEGLKELKLKLSDIDQIILTHHHPDHAGGADFFSPNVPLIGHFHNRFWLNPKENMAYIRKVFLQYAQEMGVPEDFLGYISETERNMQFGPKSRDTLNAELKEGDEVPGLPGWKVYETPGHASTHIVLFNERDGAMIGGDILLEKVSPNPLLEPPMKVGDVRPKSQLLLNASLKKLFGMPIRKVYAGHGNPIEEPRELIRMRLQAQHERAMKVKSMLTEQPATTFEICQALFPKQFRKVLGLTLSESQAQLDYLLDLGDIKEEKTEQGILYSVLTS
ncbi:MAG: MBL fold metallo-hydrolase [Bacillus sp. (in: firmicutes)]